MRQKGYRELLDELQQERIDQGEKPYAYSAATFAPDELHTETIIEVGATYPISETLSGEVIHIDDAGEALVAIPKNERGAIVLNAQQAANPNTREQVYEFMADLRLLYLTPDEFLKVVQCWNEVNTELGGKGAKLDFTDGVSLFEQSSRDQFWDFIRTQHPE